MTVETGLKCRKSQITDVFAGYVAEDGALRSGTGSLISLEVLKTENRIRLHVARTNSQQGSPENLYEVFIGTRRGAPRYFGFAGETTGVSRPRVDPVRMGPKDDDVARVKYWSDTCHANM